MADAALSPLDRFLAWCSRHPWSTLALIVLGTAGTYLLSGYLASKEHVLGWDWSGFDAMFAATMLTGIGTLGLSFVALGQLRHARDAASSAAASADIAQQALSAQREQIPHAESAASAAQVSAETAARALDHQLREEAPVLTITSVARRYSWGEEEGLARLVEVEVRNDGRTVGVDFQGVLRQQDVICALSRVRPTGSLFREVINGEDEQGSSVQAPDPRSVGIQPGQSERFYFMTSGTGLNFHLGFMLAIQTLSPSGFKRAVKYIAYGQPPAGDRVISSERAEGEAALGLMHRVIEPPRAGAADATVETDEA